MFYCNLIGLVFQNILDFGIMSLVGLVLREIGGAENRRVGIGNPDFSGHMVPLFMTEIRSTQYV